MKHLLIFLFCLLMQPITFAGQIMPYRSFSEEYSLRIDTSPSMVEFTKRIGYQESLEQEVQDGLLLIDFRKIKPPHFMTAWPYSNSKTQNPWIYMGPPEKIDCHYFDWDAAGPDGSLNIVARVCDSYKLAQMWFKASAMTPRYPLPWGKCAKNIGTVCAVFPRNKEDLFFFYKNVAVKISGADNDQIAEKTAEWLFEVLKAFPRDRMDAPFVLRRRINNY